MSEVKTVEDAVRKADSFIGKYYSFYRLASVKKATSRWIVRYNVTVFGPKMIATIELNEKTGEVVEYTSA